MWTALVSILTAIGSNIADSWNKYQERKQAEHEVTLARIEAERQVAVQQVVSEADLNKVRIQSTGKFFKYFTFVLWFFPFILSTFWPEKAAIIFQNWQAAPDWYIQSVLVILFTIWGISVSKDSIANIFSGLSSYFKEKRQLDFNKKIFYDALRNNKGTISQYEVEIFEKAIKAAQGQNEQK